MTAHASKVALFSRPAAVALALALASSGCHSSAQRAGESIADKNASARGGLKAWRKVRSMSLSGQLEAGKRRDPVQLAMAYSRSQAEMKAAAKKALALGHDAEQAGQVQLPFVMELKRPRKTRVEVRFQGQAAVQVFDGTKGSKLRPFLGRREVEPFTADELQAAAQQTDLDGPLIDYAGKGSRVELLGTEKVEGRDAYKLAVTSPTGAVRHVWVDTQTFLDVRVDGTRKLDGKPRPVWTSFREYRSVDGLMIPYVLETSVEGVQGSEKIRIERVALNPSLDDRRFTRPD